MVPDPDQTIVALSAAPGPGARAIVRLSGPEALQVGEKVCHASLPRDRRMIEADISLPDVKAPFPATFYVWPGPGSYTGQDLVEIHTLSCPPLLDLVVAKCLEAGARAAQPGEFTLRAFLAGKLDLTRAEAVLAVIDAGSRDELKQALSQLAGGMARPLQELREDLLDLLADVEAALDFGDEDIRFVQQEEMLHRITKGLALITLLKKQLEQRALGQRPFRVVLVGKPNAGKSSLFNALAGTAAAIVSAEPGTTRDYLVRRLEIQGIAMELVDTAGQRKGIDGIEETAQGLSQDQVEKADLLLHCVEVVGQAALPVQLSKGTGKAACPTAVWVGTKCDLGPPGPGHLSTSAHTGLGLAELKEMLGERARAQRKPALAPSLSRCRHHVEACLDCLRRAHAEVLEEDPPELVALELRTALEELGAMVGAVYTDDLLDRIFSRFCIGK
jgi:tRNA modification GTPase